MLNTKRFWDRANEVARKQIEEDKTVEKKKAPPPMTREEAQQIDKWNRLTRG